MKMPDALAPYASLIKWGLIVLLAGGLFVSGCNHGVNRGEEDRDKLQDKITLLETANASWAEAAKINNEHIDSNKAVGEKLIKEGEKAAGRSEKEQGKTAQAIQSNQNKLEDAQRDPRCNELLRMQVCPTVPLP